MSRLCFALLLWLSALAGAEAAPSARGEAVVTARLTPEGVHAAVTLDRPVTGFSFTQADVVREGDFDLLTPGLTLKGDTVTSARPFRRFELRIRPIAKERDAKYPAHYRIGDGGVVYAPALVADPAAWRTRLSFATAPGHIRLPEGGVVSDSFVYLGPAGLRREHEYVTVVSAPGTPEWLTESIRSDFTAAVRAYAASLRLPLPRKPLLLIKHDERAPGAAIADVTPGGVAVFRFGGPLPTDREAVRRDLLTPLVLHEAFHFWNGGLASNAEGTPSWLHEGGAEYASLLGGESQGVLSEADLRARLGDALARCRAGLKRQGDRPISELEFLDHQIRYPCGMVIQWAADLHVRRATAGGRTVMDAWADTIRIARTRPSTTYGLGDFHAAAAVREGAPLRPVQLLVAEGGAERWRALPAALNALGAEVAVAPTAATRRTTALYHLMGISCTVGEQHGFGTVGATITLDTHAGCGVLAGKPVLRTLEGGDPFALTAATYAALQRKCASGAPVSLTTADGRTLEAPCNKPLRAAPDAYLVTRWRPEPPSSGRSPRSAP